MTKEEAIKRIRQDLDVNGKYLSKEYKEALNMAIESLQEPIDLKGQGTVVTMSIQRAKERAIKTLRAEPSDDIEGDIDFHCDLKHNRMTWYNNITESPNEVVEKNDEVIEPTDLISREDAIEAVENLQTEQWIDSDIDYNNGLQSAIAEIRALPSADRPSGEWVYNNKSGTFKVFTCSECGLNVESDMWCYCPNCGAKMGGNSK